MKSRGIGLKILLAIAGFMVLTLIFFGGALIIFDYLIEQPAQIQSNLPKAEITSSEDLFLQEEVIPLYDSYNFLDDQEKIAYKKIVEGLLNYQKKIPVSNVDTLQIERVLLAIDNDKPEIFWVEELAYYFNEYTDEVSQVEVQYDYDETQKEARQKEIDQAYREYLIGIDEGMDEYAIVKATYEYVVKNTVYGENEDDQNIYSVFGKKQSVCAGYAKAMKYLLDRQKIDCSYVAGFVDVQGAHAWNLVLIDGEYYYLDATWGEFDGGNSNPEQNISYDYFAVTTKTLEMSHEIDDSLVVYPEFTATAANYFVRENRLYDLSNENEKRRLKNDLTETMGIDYFHFAVIDNSMLEIAEAVMDEALGDYTFFVDEDLLTFTITI